MDPQDTPTGHNNSGEHPHYSKLANRSTHQPLSINQRRHSAWYSFKPAISVATFIIGVIVVATGINAFVFQSYYVEGTSMSPTLHDDDRLIVSKAGHSFADLQGEPYIPARGDIVVLDSELPSTGGRADQLIKRIIGLPGERVHVENGNITVFNDANPEGFNVDTALGLELAPTFSTSSIDIQLAANEVFVTGDNRGPGGSLDSRSFGPVKLESLQGRLWARIFPFSDAEIF